MDHEVGNGDGKGLGKVPTEGKMRDEKNGWGYFARLCCEQVEETGHAGRDEKQARG